MITRNDIIEKARQCGFEDIGFTTAEPFTDQRELLESMESRYGWLRKVGIDLTEGTDPAAILPGARTVIVLMEVYFRQSYPRKLEKHFGRCYLDDDRVTKDGLALRIKEFRGYLRENGIDSKVPFNLPHRVAASRAGLGDFGKNCLFYSHRVAGKSSYVLPIAVVIDREFEPDEPSGGWGCPDWCRNACVAACPTRALQGNGTIDPLRCVSYLTYYGNTITPKELREPMGLYVYGCDRCQDVCPRNRAWLAEDLPENEQVSVKAPDFDLVKLLHMDREFFTAKIWPHMFYMSPDMVWKWKMNVARVMGNTGDRKYVPELIRALHESDDERALGMVAWALGKIGGHEARDALAKYRSSRNNTSQLVREELDNALKAAG